MDKTTLDQIEAERAELACATRWDPEQMQRFLSGTVTRLLGYAYERLALSGTHVDVVFDGPPSPEGPRFIEVERDGLSINAGEWIEREDGRHILRIVIPRKTLAEAFEDADRGLRVFSDAVHGYAGEVWDSLDGDVRHEKLSTTFARESWRDIPRGYQNTLIEVLIRL